MKFCPSCGAEVTEDMNNCPNCGTNLKSNEGNIENQSSNNEQTANNDISSVNNEQVVNNNTISVNNDIKIEERNLVLCIVLTFVTCGIYGLYWFYTLTEDSNNLCSENVTASGGLAILYSIITCGIYSIYWSYKAGKKVLEFDGEDQSVLYLVLSIFGLGIINYCLLQDKLNKYSK